MKRFIAACVCVALTALGVAMLMSGCGGGGDGGSAAAQTGRIGLRITAAPDAAATVVVNSPRSSSSPSPVTRSLR